MATDDLSMAINEAEGIVTIMKDEVLNAFSKRCSITSSECASLHLDACRSRLDGAECDDTETLEMCAADKDCGGTVKDLASPTVRVPANVAVGDNLNPLDPNAIETMCYSVLLNQAFRENYDLAHPHGADAIFWGAWTGIFRYFPGNAQDVCGSYDPRLRPWYVAASSGPKDVVIVMDISGSMLQGNRLALAKEEAIAVLQTLSADKFVNVVTFSAVAHLLTEESQNHLVPADSVHLDDLVHLVEDIEVDLADPGTNFELAFRRTFDLLDETIRQGETAGCQTAILFMTDGEATLGFETSEVVDMIEVRNKNIGANIFTFSLGESADKATAKTIACNTGGIYQHVEDGSDLSQAMSFFYRYYAIGFGSLKETTIKTQIYEFSTDGKQGFTVAAPAYENSGPFPNFLGVIGLDYQVQTFLDLGYSMAELEDKLAIQDFACPIFNLTECQIQSFRASISIDSICPSAVDCSTFGLLEPDRCMAEEEYPHELWSNTDFEGLSFKERTCCDSDVYTSDLMEPTCSAEIFGTGGSRGGGSVTEIVVAVGLVSLFAAIFAVLLVRHHKRKKAKNNRSSNVSEAAGPPEDAPRVRSAVESHYQ